MCLSLYFEIQPVKAISRHKDCKNLGNNKLDPIYKILLISMY
jgi:hypothetical protein